MSQGGLFSFLAAQRRFVMMVVVVLSIGGIWAATQLPSAIYPELTFSRITVVVEGSSLGSRQVLFSITRPIEEAVSVVPGVSKVASRAIRGGSEINVTFARKTDMAYALQQLQARVNQVRNTLPAGLDIQVERLTPALFPVLSYNLEGGDPATLYDIARYQIRPLLSRVPGVGRVDVMGNDQREIEVLAEPARLAAAGLTYDDLATAIRESIAVDAVGRTAANYRQYLIVTATEAHTTDDVGNVMVRAGMRVKDVARVIPGTEDHVRIIAGDGRPAAQLNITRQPGGNSVAIADSIARIAASVDSTLPAGVHLIPVYDQAALVRDAVTSVRDAMLIGAVLAIIVLLLFLRHARVTAISAASIPLTMVITVFIMWMVGQTFNLMTLGAMAIAIGLVIDDAVVITENIVRHARLTPDRTLAVREALQELIWPVTSSTLTTVVVFLPLGLLGGVEGQFFTALSITLTIAVLVSLALSLTLIPLLSERFLKDTDSEPPQTHGILNRVGRGLDTLSDTYEQALLVVLPRSRAMVITALVLVGIGILAHRYVQTGFLPAMDEGAFVLDYWTPGGTALAETDRELRIIEGILAKTPEVTATSRRTGAELGLFATEQNRGDMVVRLAAPGKRKRTVFEVMDDVRVQIETAVPRVRIEFVQILSDVINDLAGVSRPVELKLFGPDLAALEAYARDLSAKVEGIPGIEDIYDGVSEPTAELTMHIDATEAARAGFTPGDVGAAVSGALLGVPAGEIRLEDRAVGVRVRAPDAVRNNAAALTALPVLSPLTRAQTPLGALARFEPTETRAELHRENQQQIITIGADIVGRDLGSVMSDVRAAIAATPPPPGIRLEVAGQYASQQEAFRSLLLVLTLAGVCVVGVMVVQFQSFVEPLVVVLAAPLSFGGAMLLLLLTGTPLNVSSFMGLILLVGLIVKNGIILLDFTRHKMRDGGMALEPAIREAARVRLRPILMTTLCTLFGLLPLALGLGAGSELQRPLALAVIGGLALSTPITLFVVPTLLVAIRGRAYTLDRSSTS
ncbi:MAG: efflux RND transporter permease subunit [Gemmatimonadota bacterium]